MVLKHKLLVEWAASNNGTAKLAVKGLVDHNNYLDFEESIRKGLSGRKKCKMLVVDCRELEYVNSAGFSVLLNLVSNSKTGDMKVALIGLNNRVKDIINILGLDKVFILADSEGDLPKHKS